ncbi:MAG TPA: transcription termination factor NusA [Thermoanaerobaculia bacterium]|nr:transcription termination factor NusA [Thermoanaerobaculia bacterium]HUM29563.1 transcription termination factor NusA [Thermoanaerobaculia bacterium]HXK67946.1 transcription termination factor NusA [Thermoanaerobaculia bacterium]
MDLIYAIKETAREKDLDVELIIHALEDAMAAAARRFHRIKGRVVAHHDPEKNIFKVFHVKDVVDEVEDPVEQISLEDAQKDDPGLKAGDLWKEELETTGLGRIAAQTAKQVLFQRIRDAERSKIAEEYNQKIGDLITGSVKRFEKGEIVVDLGKAEGKITREDQSRMERWSIGERIRAVVVGISPKPSGPQVLLSRTDSRLLIRLMEMEVPEIYDGTVIIKNAVREAGERAKVAVFSRDRDVDPVGACVGMKGGRVQAVTRELRGEKIDVIPFAEDIVTYAQNALAPAKINRVLVKGMGQSEKQLDVVVDDEQLSLAIGKKGQNVRLASQLISVRIEIKSEHQVKEEVSEALARIIQGQEIDEEEEGASDLTLIPGVGPSIAEKLIDAGYPTIESLLETDAETLAGIEGIGMTKAQKILDAIEDLEEIEVEDEEE